MIKTVEAIRYVTPLREGGSLPAIVEADDGQLYVLKFVGAGQGAKALVAEVIAGEIGRQLGLNVPELVIMNLDPAIGVSEPDAEIQDLLRASSGLNLGMAYLPNAVPFNLLLAPPPDSVTASLIVWLDAFVTNVDRTPENVNMLLSLDKLWLIDHGAALYFHHTWKNYLDQSRSTFPLVRQHTLITLAGDLLPADTTAHSRLNEAVIRDIVDQVPEAWLQTADGFESVDAHRQAYVSYLVHRLQASSLFVEEAIRAYQSCL